MNTHSLHIGLILFVSVSAFAQIPLMEDFIIIKNESAINTEKLEYSPAFYKDGLVFISTKVAAPRYKIEDKKINTNIMSIYRARRNSEGVLVEPEVFSEELLSPYHEGPLTFDRTNQTLYFTRNNIDKKVARIRKLKIYSIEKDGQAWNNLRELPFNDDDFDTAHPTIAVENDALYFASDRTGTLGGMDLWVSYRDGDDWLPPVNLGPEINTPQNEVFPYIHADGTLYFASNGRGGSGQLDLFMTWKERGDWITPINLEKPFNSEYDDFGIIVDRDNKNGYFSSNRPGGNGADDIYAFNIITDRRVAAITKKKKPVEIKIKDQTTGEKISDVKVTAISLDDILLGEALTDSTKKILRLLPSKDGLTYRLVFDKGQTALIDEQGQVMLWDGSQILKIEKEGYQPAYITATPDMLKKGLDITMEKLGDCVQFAATIYDQTGRFAQAGAQVILTDLNKGKQIILVSDANGKVTYCLECNGQYSVMATRTGKVSEVFTFSTRPCDISEVISRSIYIKGLSAPLVKGTVIQLPHIYFNFNDAALRPDARKDLDAVTALLGRYPELVIELASHTDARGTKRYNLELSQARSQSVLDYLLAKGINRQRLVAKGYGEAQIQNRCVDGVRCSEAEHQANRRTALVVLETGSTVSQLSHREIIEAAPADNSIQSQGTESFGALVKNFFVIAGTFKNAGNATNRMTDLKRLGYAGADIVQFQNSPYHSVVAGQYENDAAAAQNLASEIQAQHGIRTFVKSVEAELK